jgi:hypothetical protein
MPVVKNNIQSKTKEVKKELRKSTEDIKKMTPAQRRSLQAAKNGEKINKIIQEYTNI